MLETASALAGLGLFLSGLHLLSGSMQALAGQRLRLLLSGITDGYWKRVLAGISIGAVTQSTSGSAFICMGLANSGLLSREKVLTLLAWSSAGTSLLVFLVAIDIRLAGLYLVALVGIAHLLKLDRYQHARHSVMLMFALGILLFGLGMIKEGGQLIQQSEWAREFIEFASEISLFAFLVGVLVTLLTQSASTVTIVAITLNLTGVIGYEDAVIIVFGANIGSGLSLLLMTSHLDGLQKQLAVYQCLVKGAGVVVLLPLFFLFQHTAAFSPSAPASAASTALHISLIYLYMQVAGAVAASLLNQRLQAWLARTFPEPQEHPLAKPQFIYPEAAEDPDTALILVKREQDRLLGGLADFLQPLRSGYGQQETPGADERHRAGELVAGEIKSFMEALALKDNPAALVARIFALQGRNEAIISLQASLLSFVNTLISSHNVQNSLSQSMVEALHLVLTVLQDTVTNEEDADMLMMLTSDRSALMEQIRSSLLGGEGEPDIAVRQSLFVSTGIFERVLWLVRQIVVADQAARAER
ncbi:MAG: hypothetical protein RL194_521 [Pseudomonadota bacterium]